MGTFPRIYNPTKTHLESLASILKHPPYVCAYILSFFMPRILHEGLENFRNMP